MEEQRASKHSTDALDERTGLLNSNFLRSYIPKAFKEADNTNSKLALISIDINNFHSINLEFGHDTGDTLLRTIGQRLQETLRASDIVSFPSQKLIHANGNQFLIVGSVEYMEDVSILANKILNSFSSAFELNGINKTLTPSIGVSVYPDN
ncbi:MAG: GGDEF domain-containing protein [Patescibacteria group bacterium]